MDRTFPLTIERHSVDPIGRPLDLVVFSRSHWEYFPHKPKVSA